MANKNEARKVLDELLEQRDQVLARIAELEAHQEDLDVSDVAGSVARLQEEALELVALRSVLGGIEMRIQRARAEVGEEQAVEDLDTCRVLWDDERSVVDAVVLTTQLLKLQLDDLQKVQRRIQDVGGVCRAKVPLSLSKAVFGALEAWRASGIWQDEMGKAGR